MEEAIRPEALDEEREFRDQQASGLGATDTPKILGLSKYGTALSVYQSKVGTVPPHEPNLPAWLGLKLQATVGELYTAATGQRLRAANSHYRNRKRDWLVCHLDYRGLHRPDLLIECKTRAYMKGWGEDGTQVIPADVWAQVQHEMAVVNATECHVAVLFGHHSFRVYPIKRDEQFIQALLERLDDFWHNNVLARVPPLPSGSDIDTAILSERYPENDPFYRNTTPEQDQIVAELRDALEIKAGADRTVDEFKNLLREIIGEHLGLTGPWGTITWKKTAEVKTVSWEMVANVYESMVDELLLMADPGENDDYVSRLAHIQSLRPTVRDLYTSTKEGVRRFTMTFEESR